MSALDVSIKGVFFSFLLTFRLCQSVSANIREKHFTNILVCKHFREKKLMSLVLSILCLDMDFTEESDVTLFPN